MSRFLVSGRSGAPLPSASMPGDRGGASRGLASNAGDALGEGLYGMGELMLRGTGEGLAATASEGAGDWEGELCMLLLPDFFSFFSFSFLSRLRIDEPSLWLPLLLFFLAGEPAAVADEEVPETMTTGGLGVWKPLEAPDEPPDGGAGATAERGEIKARIPAAGGIGGTKRLGCCRFPTREPNRSGDMGGGTAAVVGTGAGAAAAVGLAAWMTSAAVGT
jgi:hypothetical protein